MKKNKIILAVISLVICLFAASCNLDATQGLFREISTSVESTGTRIIKSAGYDTASNTAYFVSDYGLCSQSKGSTEIKTLVNNTETMQIREASLAGGKINYIYQNPANSQKYYATFDPSTPGTTEDSTKKIIAISGDFEITLDADNHLNVTSLSSSFSLSKATTQVANPDKFQYINSSQSVLSLSKTSELLVRWQDTDAKDHITLFVNTGSELKVYDLDFSDVTDLLIASFAFNQSNNSLVLIGQKNSSIYYVENVTSSTKLVNSSKKLTDSFTSTPSASFCANDKYYFKGKSAYSIVTWGASNAFTFENITSGFANGLIVTTPALIRISANEVLVFTEDSGLFKMDVSSTNNPVKFSD